MLFNNIPINVMKENISFFNFSKWIYLTNWILTQCCNHEKLKGTWKGADKHKQIKQEKPAHKGKSHLAS